MQKSILAAALIGCAALFGSQAFAQQPPPVYAPGLTLEMAKKMVAAAEEEAKKNNWFMAIAVVTNGAHLVHFSKLDNTQFASVDIAQHKARTAALYRRSTKVFQDALSAEKPNFYVLTLDGVIAVEGGLPILVDGKVMGGIGCSGGTAAQDGQVCQAGLAALK